MSDVNNIRFSVFLDAGVALNLREPFDRPGVTNWILQVGRFGDVISLQFRDKADLWRLVDEIVAKAGPR